MADLSSTRIGQKFLELVPRFLIDITKELNIRNSIAEAALYPYPDLCRRCVNKDSVECISCVPSSQRRASGFYTANTKEV